jgi:hypothetical protein
MAHVEIHGFCDERFLREEPADRIDADFHFGLPDSEAHRAAEPESSGTRFHLDKSFGSRVTGALLEVAPIGDPIWRR